MDEFNYEPLKPEDIQVEASHQPQVLSKRVLVSGGIALILFIAVGVYFLFFSPSENLIAQPLDFNIANDPATVIISISNKTNDQAVIAKMYPVYFGREHSGLYARSIDAALEGASLPLVINPNEVRLIKMTFHVDKKDLDMYCDPLRDSSHIVVFRDGPPKGQLEGNLGLAWKVNDSNGKSYTNTARLVYYILTPSPEGFKDPTCLTRSGFITDDPFELCTQEEIIENK